MKTYKKGISLIVLIITVIVLAILATTVIISLNETNIISKTNQAVFKSDMANYKEMYQLYLTEQLLENSRFNSSSLNITSEDDEFTEIFGNNVKEEYKQKLQVEQGKLVYKSMDAEEVEVLQQLGMAVIITPVSEVKIGALVEYTPTASPTGTYSGATYVNCKESTTNYTPGSMKWVYLGQDENGNKLLTSQEITSFTMTVGGQDGWVTGPDRMDTLCNTLYGNTTYGVARNMKIEDVNIVLGYTGPLGSYVDADGEVVTTDEPMTFGEIETLTGVKMGERTSPRLSETKFEDFLSNRYTYTGTTYKAATTDEYKVIFGKSDNYCLSSPCAIAYGDYARFNMLFVSTAGVGDVFMFESYGDDYTHSFALRPVIVLNSNIQFGERNTAGELTLVEM